MPAPDKKTTPDPRVQVSAPELVRLRFHARALKAPGRMRSQAVLAGAHRSRFRGRGMDYVESRHYQAGDDIRAMDWRVTARTGQAHTKLYQEERERPLFMLVDLGPTMFFATRGVFKSVMAAKLATLMAWSTVARGDRVGGLMFNGRHRELPPRGGRRGVMRFIRQLAQAGNPGQARDSGDHGINGALERLRRLAHPGAMVVILSDFYGMDADTSRHLVDLRRHCDLLAFQILDPVETAVLPHGRYGVSDGRRFGILDTGRRRTREAYERFVVAHHRSVRQRLRESRIPLVQVSTTDDPVDVLRRGPGKGCAPGEEVA